MVPVFVMPTQTRPVEVTNSPVHPAHAWALS
jgi:hypothetical protein